MRAVMKQILLKIIICLIIKLFIVSNAKIVFCYWGTWSYYRPDQGKFQPELMDANLCTHIGYAFFGITDDGDIKLIRSNVQTELRIIQELVALKQHHPHLKVIASVGGWNEGSIKYSSMAADPQKRSLFINSTVDFFQQHGFDGLDLDWEYPSLRGGILEDRQNYIILLQELKSMFTQKGYSLSVAVNPGQWTASKSYNISAISEAVDFIHIMTYNFHSASHNVSGYKSPLQGNDNRTVSASINFWLSQGASPQKMVIGIPFSGLSFALVNSSLTTVGSPVSGPGTAGPITRKMGHLGYNEICGTLHDWTRQWDDHAKVPYAYKGNEWISYENEQSIIAKMEFVKQHDLAGVMVWSIETDDFHGKCGGIKFPLLRAINRA